jgi:flavin reductase (DIM6/NTAB) family NADH-FMN oxidoreductase RutF
LGDVRIEKLAAELVSVREPLMNFDFAALDRNDCYKLLLGTVMPRPIAWTTTRDENGAINAAPFSFFNIFGPDTLGISIGSGTFSGLSKEFKDTLINVRATREFVVNLVPFSAAQKMVVTSIPFPRGVQEPLQAGLTLIPSVRISVPRIHESPVSLECTLLREISLDDDFNLVLGRILMAHVKDEAVIDGDRLHIDALKLDLVGRMEGSCYARTIARFDAPYISIEAWKESRAGAERPGE